MKYFIAYGDTGHTTIEEIDTIEELKKKVSKIQNQNKWFYIAEREIKDVA